MTKLIKKRTEVRYLQVSAEDAGQRVDNFLTRHFKKMPRPHLYRLLRKGEVRVNAKRVSACHRLNTEDRVRLPPVYLLNHTPPKPPTETLLSRLSAAVLYEDDDLLVMNKPAGLPVHGGSAVKTGLIEALHHLYPQYPHLELAHRLDIDTSGCLVLAKNKRTLRELHALFRDGLVKKIYCVLTKGIWNKNELSVSVPLHKQLGVSHKHKVVVSDAGKASCTIFRTLETYTNTSLMEASLLTGRTHQIRVHAAYQKHPVLGDDRYGDTKANQVLKARGLKRIFLHASSVELMLPSTKKRIKVHAPLDLHLQAVITHLKEDLSHG